MDVESGEIDGVAPAKLLQPGHRIEVGNGRKWTVKRTKNGMSYSCTCTTWRMGKGPRDERTCPHIVELLGEAYDKLRIEVARDAAGPDLNNSALSKAAKRKASDDGASQAPGGDGNSGDESKMGGSLQDEPMPYRRVEEGRKLSPLPLFTFNGREGGGPFTLNGGAELLLGGKWNDKNDPTGWWLSEKLDGVRAWWDGSSLWSRTGRAWNPPKWWKKKLPTDLHLDGELWIRRDAFEITSGICRRTDQDGWIDVNFMVFDVTNVSLVYEERIKELARRLPDGEMSPDAVMARMRGGHVAVLPIVRCEGRRHLDRELKAVEAKGGEGLMLRKAGSAYVGGRTNVCYKLKSWYEAETIVLDHRYGKDGSNRRRMGNVVCQMENGTFFEIGSGFTDDMRERWWPPRNTIIRYRFQELSRDGTPRFPIFEGVAADKTAPKDAIVRSTKLRASGINDHPQIAQAKKKARLDAEASSSSQG